MSNVTARVAALLYDGRIAVNKGANGGVKNGMRFRIVRRIVDVLDPETKALLDTIVEEKARYRVIETRAKIAICALETSASTASQIDYFAESGKGLTLAQRLPLSVYSGEVVRVGDELFSID